MAKILNEQEFYASYVGDASLYSPRQDGRKKQAKVDNYKNTLSFATSYFNGVELATIEDTKTLSKLITDNDELLGYLKINRTRNLNNSFFLATPIFNLKYGTNGFNIENASDIMNEVTLVYDANNISICYLPISKNTKAITCDMSGENISTTNLIIGNELQYYLYGFTYIPVSSDNNKYIKIVIGFTEWGSTNYHVAGQRTYDIILYDGNFPTSQPITSTENISVKLYITYNENTKSLWKYLNNDNNINDYYVTINLNAGESSTGITETDLIYKISDEEPEVEPIDIPIDITNPGPKPSGVSISSVEHESDINYLKYTGRDKILDTIAHNVAEVSAKTYSQTIDL